MGALEAVVRLGKSAYEAPSGLNEAVAPTWGMAERLARLSFEVKLVGVKAHMGARRAA